MVKIKKLSGSTLIEVLIAMVIIMMVFTIAIRIVNNVLYSSPVMKKIQVQQQLEVFSEDIKRNGYPEESETILDSVHYHFEIDSSVNPGIQHLSIIASQHGKTLGEIQLLYKAKKDEN